MSIVDKARRDWGYKNPTVFDTELGCDVKIVDGIKHRLVLWGPNDDRCQLTEVYVWTPVDEKSYSLVAVHTET